MQQQIWRDYVWKKQSIAQLSQDYGRSKQWVRHTLDAAPITPMPSIEPHGASFVADTTFFGRKYGITVFRIPEIKANVWWKEVENETASVYEERRRYLESQGWIFESITLDGRPSIHSVFSDIPLQMCHFHQIKIITKHLTKRPKLPAGQELRHMALTLSHTNEADFREKLTNWHQKWGYFLKERTIDPETQRWFYTHRRIRSAYRSLNQHFPFLFTYQKYSKFHIPNTTNSLDGTFSHFKTLIRIHRGLKKHRRWKVIQEILSNNH